MRLSSPLFRLLISGLLTIAVSSVVSAQTIYSDNFNSYSSTVAPIAFTSSYPFLPNSVTNGMNPAQVYSITENLARNNGTYSSPNTQHPAITTSAPNSFGATHAFYDHTSNNGSGKYLAINAGGTTSVYRPITSIVVSPNTLYSFDMWMMSWTNAGGNFGRVEVGILGNISSFFSFLDAPSTGNYDEWGTWALRSFTFFSGNNTTINIDIRNINVLVFGDDYACDDISVSVAAVPEPGAMALTCAAGLSGLVVAYRKYRLKKRWNCQ